MPQLGESVTEGTITRWLKSEGDEVAMDEPLAEVDTDKVNAELPSPVAGKIEKFLVSEGSTVDVGTEIALVAVAGESDSPAADAPPQENVADDAPTEEFPASSTEAQPVASEEPPAVGTRASRSEGNGRGTGAGGRVTRKDIEGYIEEREELEEYAQPEREVEHVPVYEGDRVEDLSGIRRAIANRMSASKREAPHAWTMVEVDVSGLVALREREKAAFEAREGVKLTYLPFIVKAVVESLKEHPVLNSVWD